MEAKFKSLSLFDFQKQFSDDDSCLKYLSNIKWSKGYVCPKCSNEKYCSGSKKYERQCTVCRYLESPTAGTLFHGCKFSLLKAFYIVYYLSTNKQGIASTEASRKLALRQKTCWLFGQKVKQAMKSSKTNPLIGKVDVDETYVGGEDEKSIGRNEGKKKIVVVAIEKKGKGVSRMYARVIEKADRKNISSFMIDHIDFTAQVRTDKWTAYTGVNKIYPKLKQEKSENKGKNFNQLHRSIMMFKAWMRGVHHSVRHLQAYLDEYTYRFNRHKMKEGIFENLITRMVKAAPCTYQMIIE